MKKQMRKKRDGAIWLVAPMAIWTILFVVATLGYILYLSFSTRAENGMGVTAQFTLDNYLKILNPSYLKVLGNSLKLAAITTIICLLVGYPFGYLMAKASPKAARSFDAAGDCAFLDKRAGARVWLAHPSDGRRAGQYLFADVGGN